MTAAAPAETPAASAPLNPPRTGEILRRGWRVFVPVVIGNAAVQAATTAPFLTPAPTVWFILLAVVSAAALIAGAALIVAQADAGAKRTRLRVPGRVWAAASVCVVVVGTSALVALPLVPLALTLAFVVLPGVAKGDAWAGFRAFARSPLRAVGLAFVTLATVVVLWVGALLLGFLITGVVSAALTWLLFGAAATVLACAWTRLSPPPRR